MGEFSEQFERKSYPSPKIIYELELETHAGSPLGVDEFDGLPLIP
jgi:hypothetical protein